MDTEKRRRHLTLVHSLPENVTHLPVSPKENNPQVSSPAEQDGGKYFLSDILHSNDDLFERARTHYPELYNRYSNDLGHFNKQRESGDCSEYEARMRADELIDKLDQAMRSAQAELTSGSSEQHPGRSPNLRYESHSDTEVAPTTKAELGHTATSTVIRVDFTRKTGL